MRTFWRNLLVLPFAIAMLMTGCTAVPIATVSAAAGAAAATTEVTSAVYKMGKLRSAEMASVEKMRTAVYAAIDELSYTIVQDTGNSKIVISDDRGRRTVITVKPITETACVLLIDVGLFGPQHVARLIYERITVALMSLREEN